MRVRGKRDSERRKNKRKQHFSSQSPVNRWSKPVEARDKVGLHDENYAWVLKTAGFFAFQKVEVSPTLVISCLVAM